MAPKHHVHALARGMLADPTVAYPEGVDTPVLGSIVPDRADKTRLVLEAAVHLWAIRLGVKPDEIRDAFVAMLGTVKDAGIDARAAQAFLGGA